MFDPHDSTDSGCNDVRRPLQTGGGESGTRPDVNYMELMFYFTFIEVKKM